MSTVANSYTVVLQKSHVYIYIYIYIQHLVYLQKLSEITLIASSYLSTIIGEQVNILFDAVNYPMNRVQIYIRK